MVPAPPFSKVISHQNDKNYIKISKISKCRGVKVRKCQQYQNVTMLKCQNAMMSQCQNIKLRKYRKYSKYQNAIMLKCHNVKKQNVSVKNVQHHVKCQNVKM